MNDRNRAYHTPGIVFTIQRDGRQTAGVGFRAEDQMANASRSAEWMSDLQIYRMSAEFGAHQIRPVDTNESRAPFSTCDTIISRRLPKYMRYYGVRKKNLKPLRCPMKYNQRAAAISLAAIVSAALILLMSACDRQPHKNDPETIRLFAAAGITAAMQNLACLYSQQSGVQVRLNLASSAVLARQIESGADWDLFISANKQWLDHVVKRKSLKADDVVLLFKDRLALIVPADTGDVNPAPDIQSFAQHFDGYLAVGNPATVPAGAYAKQAMEKLGWWQVLNRRTVLAADSVAVLHYVESGQCQAGIVYLSSVKKSSKVKILHVFDETLHDSIYFFAITNADCEQGRRFLQFLTASPMAADILTSYGLQPVLKE